MNDIYLHLNDDDEWEMRKMGNVNKLDCDGERDALNVALARLAAEQEVNETQVTQIERLEEALHEYQKYNHIHNDLESYLYSMGEWALDKTGIPHRPCPEDYGLKD